MAVEVVLVQMINTPTTFILGAGASAPYGFPTGEDLVKRVLENLNDVEQCLQILRLCPEHGHEIETFAVDLKGSGKSSVDAFLEHRPKFLKLGKTCIAQALIPCEREDSLFSRDNNRDWYRYLWDQMNSDFGDFANNTVSFVTFNYDRSLEYNLYSRLLATYRKEPADVAKVVRSFSPIHLHGCLTELSLVKSDKGRRYEPDCEYQSLVSSRDSIHVISEHDYEKVEEGFKKAQRIIRKSEIICFLGFGYADLNLRRLGIPDIIGSHQKVFGSAMHLRNREKLDVKRKFDGKIELAQSEHWDSLEFLRQTVELS